MQLYIWIVCGVQCVRNFHIRFSRVSFCAAGLNYFTDKLIVYDLLLYNSTATNELMSLKINYGGNILANTSINRIVSLFMCATEYATKQRSNNILLQ